MNKIQEDDPERLTEPLDPDDPEGTAVDPLPVPGDLAAEQPSDTSPELTVPLEAPQPVGVSDLAGDGGEAAVLDFADSDNPLGESSTPL